MHREASLLAVKEETKPKQKMSKNMLKDRDFLDSIQKLQDPSTKQPAEDMPEYQKPSIAVVRLDQEYTDEMEQSEMQRQNSQKSMPAQTKKPAMRRKISKSVSNLRNNIAQQAQNEWSQIKGPGPARSGKISSSTSQSEETENEEVFDLASKGESNLNKPQNRGSQSRL